MQRTEIVTQLNSILGNEQSSFYKLFNTDRIYVH